MGVYELTEDAEIHVAEIYEYSIEHLGLDVARRYLNGLHAVFGLLAENPRMGTDWSQTKSGCRRFVHESHVIYYRRSGTGVVIVCVLHATRDPARHL